MFALAREWVSRPRTVNCEGPVAVNVTERPDWATVAGRKLHAPPGFVADATTTASPIGNAVLSGSVTVCEPASDRR
jgi:hypothetical protein